MGTPLYIYYNPAFQRKHSCPFGGATKNENKVLFSRQVIGNTKYDKKNTAEKVRYVLPRKIVDMAIDMEVSTEVIGKVPGDMQ